LNQPGGEVDVGGAGFGGGVFLVMMPKVVGESTDK
jgi:hypothetical protein